MQQFRFNPLTHRLDLVDTSSSPTGDVQFLAGDSGGNVPPNGSGVINILGNPDIEIAGNAGTSTLQLTNLTKITPFIVGSNSAYTTIQSALDAANAAGGQQLVYVTAGTYTENLTFYPDVFIQGAVDNTVIIGIHTPPASGDFIMSDLVMISATDLLNSAAAGTANITIQNSFIILTDGYVFNVPNWTGTLLFDNCGEASTTDGVVNNTAGSPIKFLNTEMGAGSGKTMTLTGNANVRFDTCNINCPVNIAGSGTFIFQNGVVCRNTVTIGGSKTGDIVDTVFLTGANTSLIYNSTGDGNLSEVTFDTSASPAIGGTGHLNFGEIIFRNSATKAGTLTFGYTGHSETGTAFVQNLSFDRGANNINEDGELIIGATGLNPQIATLTAGSGISITNGPGSITIASSASPGSIIQYQRTIRTTLATCSTQLPFDDTIPQSNEGDEVMTVTITPTSAANTLIIRANASGNLSNSTNNLPGMALFQDNTANALAAASMGSTTSSSSLNASSNGTLFYSMTAGTTSATTFKIRCGCNSGSIYINGSNAARQYGGVWTAYIEVTEIQA